MPLQDGDRVSVNIIKAVDLIAADMNGKSDPYLVVETINKHGQPEHHRTEIVKKNLNPEWNEGFNYFIDKNLEGFSIKFDIYDWDRFSKDDFLGTAKILVSDTNYPINKIHQHCLPLVQTKSGALYISVQIVRKVEETKESEKVSFDVAAVDSSKYKVMTDFGANFVPCVPVEFKLTASKTSAVCMFAGFDSDAKENYSANYYSNISELGFDNARETFMSTMMKLHESISERIAQGTYKVIQNGANITSTFKESETFQQVFHYNWKFTNADNKLMQVWSIVCLPSSNTAGMLNFVYYAEDSHFTQDKLNIINYCALKTSVK